MKQAVALRTLAIESEQGFLGMRMISSWFGTHARHRAADNLDDHTYHAKRRPAVRPTGLLLPDWSEHVRKDATTVKLFCRRMQLYQYMEYQLVESG